MKYLIVAGLCVAALAGCASSSMMRLNADTAEINVNAAPVCGSAGAQRVAYEDAAIETLRAGYDGFIIGGTDEANPFGGVLFNQTYGASNSFGSATMLFRHDQKLLIKMFHRGDPGYSRTVDARSVLGPKWEQKVHSGPPSTC